MEHSSILLSGFVSNVARVVVEHIGVTLAVAVILLLITYFHKRILNLSSWFVAVRVHGKWSTTLTRIGGTTGLEVSHTQTFQVQQTEAPSWMAGAPVGDKPEKILTALTTTSELSAAPASPTETQNGQQANGKQQHHDGVPHEIVILHQFFNKVWGEAVVQNCAKPIYTVRGQLIGEKLSLIFREKNGFDSGAILLKVLSSRSMEGYEVGVDPTGKPYAEIYRWRRRADS